MAIKRFAPSSVSQNGLRERCPPFSEVADKAGLEELRIRYLGKKGSVTGQLK